MQVFSVVLSNNLTDFQWKQLGVQTVAVLYVAGYSGIVTYGLCFLVDHIPGTRIRVPEEDEIRGIE